jgi:hypothetical protein
MKLSRTSNIKMNIQPVEQVSNYIALQPLFRAMDKANDSLPKNSLPTNTEGTIQENAHSLPQVTIYNAHGIINKQPPNSLIAYV